MQSSWIPPRGYVLLCNLQDHQRHCHLRDITCHLYSTSEMANISTSLPIIIALPRELQQGAVKHYVENVFLWLHDQIKPSGQFTRFLQGFLSFCFILYEYNSFIWLNCRCHEQRAFDNLIRCRLSILIIELGAIITDSSIGLHKSPKFKQSAL